jgi:hypothetical protein|tara:strand:+ start:767 stop:1036 length:270 start_codon:yes stop_codon:yes gene_type:complete
MLSFLFSQAITSIIESIEWVNWQRPDAEAANDLATLREGTTEVLHRHNELTEQWSILDEPKDIRVSNAKRGVYLAIIKLIDAKIDSLTD